MKVYSCHGELFRDPEAVVPTRSWLRPAELGPNDFDIPPSFPIDDKMPVIWSFEQNYSFLCRIVDTIDDIAAGDLIVAQVRMPAVLPLPADLLRENVVLIHDVEPESAYLAGETMDHWVVKTNFKFYGWSIGDNSYEIRRHARNRQTDLDAFKGAFEWLDTLPLTTSFSQS